MVLQSHKTRALKNLRPDGTILAVGRGSLPSRESGFEVYVERKIGMKYLVQMSVVETANPRDDVNIMIGHLDRVVTSHEVLLQLQKEGKILAAGVPCGRRAYAFIAEVDGNKELNDLLRSLPMWSFQDIHCIPLHDLEDQLAIDKADIEKFKAAG